MEGKELHVTGVMEVDVLDPGHWLMSIKEINLASLQQDNDSNDGDGENNDDKNSNNDGDGENDDDKNGSYNHGE